MSLLSLPLEVREQIYSLYFKPADHFKHYPALIMQGFCGDVYEFEFALWRVNRQVYAEAKAVWRRDNIFVRIATPWTSAINHLAPEGHVPIVYANASADAFPYCDALVSITAPYSQGVPRLTAVILLDDLHLFTQTWFYDALSYPTLNDRLSITFTLQNPSTPLSIQRRLLLPFTQIKSLQSKTIINYAPQVRLELETGMATPIPTLAQCCESSWDLLTQADAVLPTNPLEALSLCQKAFQAIHILIDNRTRRVLADPFFNHPITTGRFANQSGLSVRIILRLKLVSRTILALVMLAQHADAFFWGMRSIKILRETMGVESDDFDHDFVATEDIAAIYARTGIAAYRLERGHDGAARPSEGSQALWGAAKRLLGNRSTRPLTSELVEFGVPSGEVLRIFGEFGEEQGSVVGQDGSAEE